MFGFGDKKKNPMFLCKRKEIGTLVITSISIELNLTKKHSKCDVLQVVHFACSYKLFVSILSFLLCQFHLCYDNIPDRGRLKNEGFILVHSLNVQSTLEIKSWWQEFETSHCIQSQEAESAMYDGDSGQFLLVFILVTQTVE